MAVISQAKMVNAPTIIPTEADNIVITDGFISSLANRKGINLKDTKWIVRQVMEKYGLREEFLRTAICESSLNPNAIGDHSESFGLWQIHLPAHPEITKEQALDPLWSTEWAAQKFVKGKQHLWTCWNKLKMVK